MNKIKYIVFSLLIAVGALTIGSGVAYATDYCPAGGGLHGYWATFTPTYRQCGTSYYTYNTESLGEEESWYLSSPMYQICNKGTPPFGPTYYYNIGSRAYIPSPHATQTGDAHYYLWGVDDSYLMIGNVDQYNTFGWAYMSTTTWEWHDGFKLSDWTDEDLYDYTVDLDAFSITNCPCQSRTLNLCLACSVNCPARSAERAMPMAPGRIYPYIVI